MKIRMFRNNERKKNGVVLNSHNGIEATLRKENRRKSTANTQTTIGAHTYAHVAAAVAAVVVCVSLLRILSIHSASIQ